MNNYKILGVNISQINYIELVEKVLGYIATSNNVKLIFTPNPEIIYASIADQDLKAVLNTADLSLPDGIGIIIASRILGHPIAERVTGVDAFLKLCENKVGKIFLVGSKPGVADRAVKALEQTYPGVQIVGQLDGYFKDTDSDRIVDVINKSGAEVLFIGLGAPRQEKWLLANRAKLKVKVAMVMGGSLDVISGDKTRAPEIFIKLNIEWLYRLSQEPSRITRMLVLPKFIFQVIINCKK